MATFPTITQSGAGPQLWINSGGNITDHEAFAFTLQSAPPNVRALISDVSVFLNTDFAPARVSYAIHLTAVDEFLNLMGVTMSTIGTTCVPPVNRFPPFPSEPWSSVRQRPLGLLTSRFSGTKTPPPHSY
jgi:hypothetical protein